MQGLSHAAARIRRVPKLRSVARIRAIRRSHVEVEGFGPCPALGHDVEFFAAEGPLGGEVVSVDAKTATIAVDGPMDKLTIGQPVVHLGALRIAPDASWFGRLIDSRGRPLDGQPLMDGPEPRPIFGNPPDAGQRRALGKRLSTGLCATDTFLPIARGQRLGLFAGSGVGKSNLMGTLANGLDADVCVVGLVGERGREVGAFVRNVLGPAGMAKSVVVAETSDQPALSRRRAAMTAMTVAEYFRDQGLHVLLMLDSVTRLAEAHREIAAFAEEPATLRGFPPSVVPLLAGLTERAGPGSGTSGDITAVLSVLVAGSDMDEPIADILRGLLDGHIVLSRDIAERGRFPAIDILQSVSRSLPDVASPEENALLAEARSLLSLYESSELMIRSGLYQRGADSKLDRAVCIFAALDAFVASRARKGEGESFRILADIVNGEENEAESEVV